MNAIGDKLRYELRDKEYSEGYAESFLNTWIATQIKVLREQRGLSQLDLARLIGTKQSGISRIENVNYSSWNIRTLKKLAREFNLRLRVSFETYGTLPDEVEAFTRKALERVPREIDPGLAHVEEREYAVAEIDQRGALQPRCQKATASIPVGSAQPIIPSAAFGTAA